ncbi:Far upstream element-binding protein 3 [Phytophthora nicotianae]|uniref:Far upstream element-binding protein 3 n=1 Tax=Phytophthora nicotianae TaxID=4792 RepID=A0A0W8CNQ0_PHYNI|nr:hypothetical protein AM588_10000511 [Phytophthora nicotianae]KUF85686.1 Far upstream element-binding protein 3 [Phytophthora nicotianae]
MLKAYQARKRRRVQVVATVAAIASIRGTPSDCVPRRRLNWGLHRQTLLLEGQFEQCYRMSAASFDRLLSFVRPGLLRDEIQSERRTGTDSITPENMLQMTISWLAGGSFHTTRCLAGVSPSGFYDVITAVMDALCECEELRIHSPTESTSRIEELASGFTKISKDGIMTGCVGCLDGWLCQIRAPSSREVPDVAAFFSGHYQMYGLNVQAICDSLCRFTGYCFDSPGKVGDSIAFKKWTLSDEIMELPPGYYCVGDNAYPLSDSLLVPYNKVELKKKQDSDFNFYLSQLRIRIEMAFGLLVNKWQIFKKPLVVDFKNVSKVIKTCMKLHNFCTNETLINADVTVVHDRVSSAYHRLRECAYQAADNSMEDTDITGVELDNAARGRILRQIINDHIQDFNLRRPRMR